MSDLPRCDRKYKETAEAYMQCDDEARYMLVPMLCRRGRGYIIQYACLAHLAHVFDKLAEVYKPVLVKRIQADE